jgi:ribosomal protein S6--L-glutamate ligase
MVDAGLAGNGSMKRGNKSESAPAGSIDKLMDVSQTAGGEAFRPGAKSQSAAVPFGAPQLGPTEAASIAQRRNLAQSSDMILVQNGVTHELRMADFGVRINTLTLMRIALLAGGSGWHVQDLQRAATALGHEAAIVDFRKLHGGVAIERAPLSSFDAVIVRTMPPGSLEQVVFRMDLLHRLMACGVRVVNSPAALEASIDKYLASVRLEAAGLPVPPTVVCQDADTALEAFQTLGGDVVVKPLFGSEGRGMVRVSDPELAWRTFRTIERSQSVLYLQKYIDHPGWDLRVFVLAGRVLTAMRRHANGGWRTNVAQGGRGETVRVTAAEEQLALAAATAVGAEVAGVDLLPAPGGYFVLEVNAVPGWRALANVTGVDIAGAMIRFLSL